MRFMMLVKGNQDYEAGKPPSAELMAAVAKAAEEASREGTLLQNGGLFPSSKGAKVRVQRGQLRVTDGPFSEAKELIGGFAIFELPSLAEAVERGKRFMQLHADVLGPAWEGELEIRQMMDNPPQGQCDVR